MNARRLILGATLTSLCVLIAIALSCSSALAVRGHLFSGAFGEPCSSEQCGKGQLNRPGAIAVNEATGDVYVVDRGDKRVEWFSSSGTYLGQFDGSGSFEVGGNVETGAAAPTGKFSNKIKNIAIDNSCEQHTPVLTEVTTPACHEFDPSAGDVYVAASENTIDKFTAVGEYIGQLTGTTTEAFFQLDGVSVDSNGTVWVDERQLGAGGQIDSFNDAVANEFILSRLVSQNGGSGNAEAGLFATEVDKGVYYYYFGESFAVLGTLENEPGSQIVERLKSAGEGIETIAGGTAINEPEEEPRYEAISTETSSGLALEASRHDVYVDNVNSVSRFGPDRSPIEKIGAGHLEGGRGIGIDSSTEDLYVSDAATDLVNVFVPEPPSAPKIEESTVSFVTSTSATFTAVIDPHDIATEYHFEYGPTASYGESAPVPDSAVGSDFDLHEVALHVQDLTAHTTYHFRVVAHNGDGTTYSEDQTFTTQVTSGALGLPDGRAYELVTPAAKEGALIFGQNYGQVQNDVKPLVAQASADGKAIVDMASRPTEAEPLGNATVVSLISTRDSEGWSSQVIAPPHSEATFVSINNGGEYRFFSEDLSQAILQPFGRFTPLAADASESTAYIRSDYLGGDPEDHCQSTCFQPLVAADNTRAGATFGETLSGGECAHFICGPQFIDATPDLSHAILSSGVQLTSVPTPEGGLYEWSAGRLQLISEPPEGQTGVLRLAGTGVSNEVEGVTRVVSGEYDARHAVSNDGQRLILAGDGLYLRDVATGETVRLDATQGGVASSQNPVYMTASADASRVFFLDNAGLTAESSSSGTDLYEYDLNDPANSRLKDLTPDEHTGESADVKSVIGASDDGGSVYFSAAGALTADATPGECKGNAQNPSPERVEDCNLYVRHDGVTSLIAGNWNPVWSGEDSARVSRDGKWLAFMSNRDLIGYNTDDAISGHPDQEVYLYSSDTAKLVCASCNPTGARPVGVFSTAAQLAGGSLGLGGGSWAASTVPPLTSFDGRGESRYQPRYLSDRGRLFFNSDDALVAQDVNGTQDVYEYEPSGIGSCDTSTITFSVRSGGCVGLISSGSSAEESAFMDASETGGDVFFLTSSKLASQDFDNALDVYNAHECTIGEPCYPVPAAVPPVCSTGDACKAAPTPQPSIFGPAPSATFSGVGNVSPAPIASVKPKSLTRAQKLVRALRVCRKGARKRRAVCEAKAKKRFGLVKRSHKTSAKRKGKG